MRIEKRSLNWMPRASAWDTAQAQRAKSKEANSTFLSQQSALASTFQSSRDNMTMGIAEISGKIAAARVQAEAKAQAMAKADSVGTLSSGLSSIDTTA